MMHDDFSSDMHSELQLANCGTVFLDGCSSCIRTAASDESKRMAGSTELKEHSQQLPAKQELKRINNQMSIILFLADDMQLD